MPSSNARVPAPLLLLAAVWVRWPGVPAPCDGGDGDAIPVSGLSGLRFSSRRNPVRAITRFTVPMPITLLWNPHGRCRTRPSVRASTASCNGLRGRGRVVVEALGAAKDGIGAGLRGAHAPGAERLEVGGGACERGACDGQG